MKRVIVHWTAGTHLASVLDKDHYHYLVEADGRVVRGRWAVEANEKIIGKNYAAHTLRCNTGSIGVALCCMAGAVDAPFSSGKYPMSRIQWDRAMVLIADLCKQYNIPVTAQTVLSHAEVQETLKIPQRGKWDISRISFDPVTIGAALCGNLMRGAVSANMLSGTKQPITTNPAQVAVSSPSGAVPASKGTPMDFILERAKAAAAIIAAGLGPLFIAAAEAATGFDIPANWELWIIALLTGLVVHQVPNKKTT